VDLGRNSWAITEELDAGIRSVQDVCAEMGHDWRHVLRQRAVEASYVNKLVTEYGVAREQIVKPPQGSTQGTGNPEPTSQTTEGPAKPEPATPEPATAKTAAVAPMIGHVWNVIRDDTGKILRYEPA
jgi:biotin carboxyl carrier protein